MDNNLNVAALTWTYSEVSLEEIYDVQESVCVCFQESAFVDMNCYFSFPDTYCVILFVIVPGKSIPIRARAASWEPHEGGHHRLWWRSTCKGWWDLWVPSTRGWSDDIWPSNRYVCR